MRLIRRGSCNVTMVSKSSLRVRNLSCATPDQIVTIEDAAGDSFVGRVLEVGADSCTVRICDGEHALSREDLSVWLDSDENEIPIYPPRVPSDILERTLFKTGIPPIDALFPLQHGHSVFLAARGMRESLPFIFAMIGSALRSDQWPCMIALDASSGEARAVRTLWNHWGLEGEGLFLSDSRDNLYQSMAPLRDGFSATIAHARTGRDVFLVILDLESWFRFYQEDLALRGVYRSLEGAWNGFGSRVASRLQSLLPTEHAAGRVTVLAVLSESEIAGVRSELLLLRDIFDDYLELERDGSLSIRGYAQSVECDTEAANATLYRRQCKEILLKLDEKKRYEYPLTDQEREFETELRSFLRSFEGEGNVRKILSLLPESDLTRTRPFPSFEGDSG